MRKRAAVKVALRPVVAQQAACERHVLRHDHLLLRPANVTAQLEARHRQILNHVAMAPADEGKTIFAPPCSNLNCTRPSSSKSSSSLGSTRSPAYKRA
jgi:hypothetical protein